MRVRQAEFRENESERKSGENASVRKAGVRDNASEREAGLLRGSTAYCCCYHLC